MAAPISLVVPTLNAGQALPRLLGSATEGLAEGLLRELIVTDGGSTDSTSQIAAAAGANMLAGTAGRGGQLRRGCAVARGDWLLVLHADTELPPGWSVAVRQALTDPARAYVFRLAFRATGPAPRIVAGWANLRTRLFGLPYGDQGLLLHRDLYAAIGGYPDQPLMEDVAVARALRGRIAVLPATVVTSARRYLAEGWIRRGARNLWTLVRYLTGTSPRVLVRTYEASRPEN